MKITESRLFDLVRYMRSELHDADLINDEEYFWLCSGANDPKIQGSPSRLRLEEYDEIRKNMEEAQACWKACREKLRVKTEGLRKVISWAESVSGRVTENRESINWTYLNDAKKAYEDKSPLTLNE